MDRRSFLKRGVFGGVVLALGAVGGVASIPGDRSVKPTGPLASLSEGAFAVLAAVAARVLAGTPARPVDIAMRVDATLQNASPEAVKDIESALKLLENALTGVVWRGTATPFTELNEAAQDAGLRAWRDSRLTVLRSAYHGLRKLCLAAHYATSSAFPGTGYPGPSIVKPEPPPITARGPLLVQAPDASFPEGAGG